MCESPNEANEPQDERIGLYLVSSEDGYEEYYNLCVECAADLILSSKSDSCGGEVSWIHDHSLALDVYCDCCGIGALDDASAIEQGGEQAYHATQQSARAMAYGYGGYYDGWDEWAEAVDCDERDENTGVVQGCRQAVMALA